MIESNFTINIKNIKYFGSIYYIDFEKKLIKIKIFYVGKKKTQQALSYLIYAEKFY